MSSNSSIAVIGMGCVYPGALSPETLWENILAGRRYFRISPEERLPNQYYFDPDPEAPGKTYCNRMAVIDGWSFDPTKWKIPPITYNQSDVVHWLSLHTANEALKAANIDFAKTDKRRVGVVLGNSGVGEFHRSNLLRNRWPFVERAVRRAVEKTYSGKDADALAEAIRHYYESPFPEMEEDHLSGNMANVIAGRIANYYDFRSASYTVDMACASSLLAVINACSHIESGDMDVALAGGVDISLDPFEMVGFAKTKALAKEDIRPYDEQAEGIQTGEGCGMVVLSTETYARQHGYRIHALIKGWGMSSDGSGGITQPKMEGQKYALEKTYRKAGYAISSVGYIEGHGTGTPVGDPIEIKAIREVQAEAKSANTCYIGSIKANIGHTKAAAGVAALIKATMALERKILPPHINWHKPNPAFGAPLSTLRPSEGGPWESSEPRRASVSAFGFAGANTHITLEEVEPEKSAQASELELIDAYQESELILLSAGSPRELQEKAERLLPVARRMCQAELIDLSAALAKEEHNGKHRAALISETPWQLAHQLNRLVSRLSEGLTPDEIHEPQKGIFVAQARDKPKLAALFPGQGSQRLNMAEHLLKRFDFTRELFQDFDARMLQLTGESFQKRLFRDLPGADTETRKHWAEELRNTLFQQPAIVATSMAILQLLKHLGLEPDYATGHSLGEISALAAGGALQPQDAFQLAVVRAQAMNQVTGRGAGGMAAIGTDAESVQGLLDKHDLKLVIANYNATRQNVVSGPSAEIERVLALCDKQNIWARSLPVSHAFHSQAVASAAKTLRESLTQIPMASLQGAAVFSTSTASRLPAYTDLRELLAEQVVRPVRFREVVRKIAGEQPDLWIEIGPGQVLSGLARDTLGAGNIEVYPTDLAQEDGLLLLNRILARTFVLGFPLRTERLFSGRFHREFDPYNYNPQLIFNPCERPVSPLEKPLSLTAGGLPGELIPESVSEAAFASYMSQRSDFLKQVIELDYRNWPGATPTQAVEQSPEPPMPVAAEPIEEVQAEVTDQTMIDFVIDWIAERTGYPREFVTPDKKLRDDLNLDSIKSGELALVLSQKMEREMPLDVGVVANASIEYLVNNILEFQEQKVSMDDSLSNSWVKSFGVELSPSPLELEELRGLPKSGTVYVLGQHETGPRTEAMAAALKTNDVDVQQLSLQQAIDETLAQDLSGLVLILDEEQQIFYDISPAQFEQRMEGLATSLFLLMQKVLPSVTEREGFHCLIMRPKNANDAGSDIDGAAGFVKTLSLEFKKPGFNWKWVTLPGDWEPAAVADCAALELQYFGDRIEYHYSDSGVRLSPTAVQAAGAHQKAPRLGGLDTVLVTGGGKGITFEMAFTLAKKTGVKLGLLGSSPPPEKDADDGELATNLRRLKGKGIRHLYLQADVTRQAAVQKAVRQIERGLGRVSIILHGAGISKFSGFQEMELENYLRCLRVKASGLYNLLSAVPPKRLKALHVISSVLGRTGMFRQTDYAYANAWLDGATLAVTRNNRSLHGFSVGYSVWDGTGIGAKSGAMEMLQKTGLTPISIDQGVEAYLKLATMRSPFTTFVHTGRLNDKLEPRLMPGLKLPHWRFLENVRRFVPGVELITEASLTHSNDRYLPEHVFAGTPLMPTVMGLEAMTQTAMACIGADQLPLIRQVVLKRPMIVSEETGLVVRTLALCEPMVDGATTVVVRMRSDSDGFATDYFEIRCIFGLPQPAPETIPTPPPLPEEAYPKGPEEFAPSPLFQGRFLRRISRIFEIKEGEETLTEITVPVRAQYYSNEFEQQTQTPSPAIRDAMLQAAGLMAPPGYLPESIEQIRYFRPLQEGEKLICWAKCTTRDAQTLTTDILLYDQAGKPVEWLQGLVVKATSTVVDLQPKQRTKPLDPEQIEQGLNRILTGTPLSLAIAYDADLLKQAALKLLSMQERETLLKDVAEPRRTPRLTNLLATRKSAIQYFRDSDKPDLSPDQVQLSHEADGKPKLTLVDAKRKIGELNISLADSHGTSTAVISQMTVGIDIEVVEPRDTETWLALLGHDGYSLAFSLQRETGESFDASATRAWTLIEAGKKAYSLQRTIPRFNQIIDDSWLVLERSEDSGGQMLSTMIHDQGQKFVVSLATSEPAIPTKEQHYG